MKKVRDFIYENTRMWVEFCRWRNVRDSQRVSSIQENVDPPQRDTKAEPAYAEE